MTSVKGCTRCPPSPRKKPPTSSRCETHATMRTKGPQTRVNHPHSSPNPRRYGQQTRHGQTSGLYPSPGEHAETSFHADGSLALTPSRFSPGAPQSAGISPPSPGEPLELRLEAGSNFQNPTRPSGEGPIPFPHPPQRSPSQPSTPPPLMTCDHSKSPSDASPN